MSEQRGEGEGSMLDCSARGLGRNGWNCCCDSQRVTKATSAFHGESGSWHWAICAPLYFLGDRWVQPKAAGAGLCRWAGPGCSTWRGTGRAAQSPGSCRTGLSHELPQNTGKFCLSFPSLWASVASKNPLWDWKICRNNVKMYKSMWNVLCPGGWGGGQWQDQVSATCSAKFHFYTDYTDLELSPRLSALYSFCTTSKSSFLLI